MANPDVPDPNFWKLAEQHYDELLVLIRSRGWKHDRADDILHETFLKAFKNWSSYDQTRGSFDPWIKRISMSVASDMYRKEKQRPESLSNLPPEIFDLLQGEEAMHAQAEAEWEREKFLTIEAIRACLAKLSPENQWLIDRTYKYGLKAKDLMEETGKSENNIHQKLSRIRTRVRECVLKYIKSRE